MPTRHFHLNLFQYGRMCTKTNFCWTTTCSYAGQNIKYRLLKTNYLLLFSKSLVFFFIKFESCFLRAMIEFCLFLIKNKKKKTGPCSLNCSLTLFKDLYSSLLFNSSLTSKSSRTVNFTRCTSSALDGFISSGYDKIASEKNNSGLSRSSSLYNSSSYEKNNYLIIKLLYPNMIETCVWDLIETHLYQQQGEVILSFLHV
ncbi:hypothetical protein AGLY_013348 [Aphis glycines]|uniref:Uncharacterized protein n=1 Tax=Aphis glycines TaxID=307491 RepID=A0A6G0T6E6_APHGL|nr:hypothetical protein AGLY_013348 [Aphis glycines]